MGERAARPGEDPRIPLEQAIALRFRYLSEFVDELSANISVGGMFIHSARPHPVGSIFEFELQLDDEARPLLQGKAQVVWIRRRPADGQPAGMGVRFVELEDDSRQAILRIVARHQAAGGKPFALDEGSESGAPSGLRPRPTAADPAPVEVSGPTEPALPLPDAAPMPLPRVAIPPSSGAAAARSLDRRTQRFWMLLSALLALVLVTVLWWLAGAQRQPAAPRAEGPSAALPEPAPLRLENEPPAPAPPAAQPAAPPAAAPASEPGELAAVRAWARAWSEQRVEEYLAAYSPAFTPAGGLDRTTWERQRRTRLTAPAWIEVGLAFVESEPLGADRRRVRFVQAYDSDSYSDVVRKELELRREPDGWRIVSERVVP